jgi:hypothetical protein
MNSFVKYMINAMKSNTEKIHKPQPMLLLEGAI